ncbi:MAG TPA: 50S ribosomal protein L25, partial [Actinomycetota bacterium]|nr:50S ribosomal protein L25 [Actinomycetota bacterium]
NIGDSIRVSDLLAVSGHQVLTDPDTTIVSITAPVSEEELEALEADAGVVHEPSDEEEAAEAAEEGAPDEGESTPEGDAEES